MPRFFFNFDGLEGYGNQQVQEKNQKNQSYPFHFPFPFFLKELYATFTILFLSPLVKFFFGK